MAEDASVLPEAGLLARDAALIDAGAWELIEARGNDRVGFLHRLLTGKMEGALPGQGGRTHVAEHQGTPGRGHVVLRARRGGAAAGPPRSGGGDGGGARSLRHHGRLSGPAAARAAAAGGLRRSGSRAPARGRRGCARRARRGRPLSRTRRKTALGGASGWFGSAATGPTGCGCSGPKARSRTCGDRSWRQACPPWPRSGRRRCVSWRESRSSERRSPPTTFPWRSAATRPSTTARAVIWARSRSCASATGGTSTGAWSGLRFAEPAAVAPGRPSGERHQAQGGAGHQRGPAARRPPGGAGALARQHSGRFGGGRSATAKTWVDAPRSSVLAVADDVSPFAAAAKAAK